MPDTQRILLLSDTHGQLHPKIAALAARCEHVAHAGDIGDPRILDLLRAGGGKLHAVRGNNDTARQWPVEAHARLNGLPYESLLPLKGGDLLIVHGDRVRPAGRRHVLLRERYPQARMILYGHSHRFLIDRQQIPWVVNPGAAGRSRTFGGPSCILLSVSQRGWRLSERRFSLADWET